VKRYTVRFLKAANSDLQSIFEWIAEASGYMEVAQKFVDRIIDRCERLESFPEIGMARDDLGKGIRLLAFERKASIFYCIKDDEVQIINVMYKGRDYSDYEFPETEQ
jgi:toxin ParE1/3/4